MAAIAKYPTPPRAGAPVVPQVPMLPQFPQYSPQALSETDRQNIGFLLNPNPSFQEVDNVAAESAVAGGVPGSGFARNNQLRLRDSERINRFQIGNSMLAPYLQREQQTQSQSQSEGARLREIAAQGEQAMQQLQLEQEGRLTLQSAADRAALERLAAEGAQAMERLRVSEMGDTGRLTQQIGAERGLAELNNAARLEQTALGGAFDLASGAQQIDARKNPNGINPKYQGQAFRYQTNPTGTVITGGTPPPADYYQNGGSAPTVGMQTVDSILRKYGLS